MHAGSGDGVCAVSPGVAVRKMHSTRRNAFQMVNGERISEIIITRDGLSHTPVSLSSNREISNPTKYDTNIRIAQFIAGPHLHSDLLDAAIGSGYSAIMIHGTGLGHLPIENPNGDAPENEELYNTIKSSPIPIIIANQCINGPVDLNVYSKDVTNRNRRIRPRRYIFSRGPASQGTLGIIQRKGPFHIGPKSLW